MPSRDDDVTKPTPIAMLVTAAVAAAAALWLRRPAEVRRSAARDSAAPYARALNLRPRNGDAGRRKEAAEEPPAQAATQDQPGSQPVSPPLYGAAQEDALRAELQLLRAYQEENAALRLHLGFVERNPALVVAEVVSFGGADAWSQRLRLGKGSAAGIALNAPVLSTEGLVGHVIEVTETTADVLLVSDPNSHVACVVADAAGQRRHGILTGCGAAFPGAGAAAAPLRLDYLDRQNPPDPGSQVATSGLGGIFPAGLAVGRIRDVSLDSSGLYVRALVDPAVPLRELRTAYVLTGWEGRP